MDYGIVQVPTNLDYLPPFDASRPLRNFDMPVNAGRLVCLSTIALGFAPYNGAGIQINGNQYAIPSGGITGLANTGVFVNGVGSSNLVASTLYYVYCFVNSGVLTADFSTTTHATSSTAGNVGTEIKSGDDSRTLIGMVFVNSSNQFDDSSAKRNVVSWFNRRDRGGVSFFTTTRSVTSSVFVEVNAEIRVEFVTWNDEGVFTSANGEFNNSTSFTQTSICSIAFDGTTPEECMCATAPQNGCNVAYGLSLVKDAGTLSEGHHYATLVATSGSTASAQFIVNANTAGSRCALQVGIRG
jgi:hypothetical protein